MVTVWWKRQCYRHVTSGASKHWKGDSCSSWADGVFLAGGETTVDKIRAHREIGEALIPIRLKGGASLGDLYEVECRQNTESVYRGFF